MVTAGSAGNRTAEHIEGLLACTGGSENSPVAGSGSEKGQNHVVADHIWAEERSKVSLDRNEDRQLRPDVDCRTGNSAGAYCCRPYCR